MNLIKLLKTDLQIKALFIAIIGFTTTFLTMSSLYGFNNF